jgi:diguanylate cyclase (GGDEF)-like protein
MTVPVSFLLGSPVRLIVAIVLFVVLDLTVLVINLWIADHVADDAVAINLAGRQRMLSQQITKSLLLAHHAPDADTRNTAQEELAKAHSLFQQTLTAFDRGGTTPGGDGKPVVLLRVDADQNGRKPLSEAILLVAPLASSMAELKATGTLSDATRAAAVAYMTRHNRDILARMNLLTSALEQDSVQRISRLRIIQTGAFVLALANFLVIVLGMVRQYHQVERAGQRWRELAEHDHLTGLYNRAAFREGMQNAMNQDQSQGKGFYILVLDLDGFKPINDSFGHAAGDEMLRQVANQLVRTARESDVVARLGGDEFALLCPFTSAPDNPGLICDRVIANIDTIVDPNGLARTVRASLGVAVYPTHGRDVDELLAAADRAMYRSKAAGGARWSMAVLNRSPDQDAASH